VREANRPLTPGWVAGSVRARHMLARRIGREQASELAGSASVADALARLAGTAYGRSVRPGLGLAAAQRGVAETVLWHVRVLAGWVPPPALEPIRALAAWFELANLEDRLAFLTGAELQPPFELGGLARAWPRLAGAQSVAELRAGLARSPWGDPGGDQPAVIRLGLQLAWARRVLNAVPEAAAWAAGGAALVLARELFLAGRPAETLAALRPPGVGSRWAQADSLAALRAALPPAASWALADVGEPEELWRADAGWWRRVQEDAARLARHAQLGRATVIGSVALLGVDGWRTSGALEVAARGGRGAAREVFDAVG
jgi:hypothetical protein